MNKFKLKDIESVLPSEVVIDKGKSKDETYFSKIKSTGESDESSLTFVDHKREDKQQLVENTKSQIIICDFEVLRTESMDNKTLIRVNTPKLTFAKCGNLLFVKRPDFQIHPSSIVDPTATIHEDVYVGPGAYIGPGCEIGSGSYIYGNASLLKNVKVGANVVVQIGAVIGTDGYGYIRTESGLPIQFPHVGSVILEDEVEIGSNTCIDLGALGETRIGFGSKIDNLVHLGHNVSVGRKVYIAAQATLGGSSVVGDEAEIWMGVKIADGIKIGDRASIGLGSVVIKDVKEAKKVFGNPGREFGSV